MIPDATEPCKTNGGASGQEEFCDITLDKLVDVEKDMEATLYAHSSHVKLKDYEGGNLQRGDAFHQPIKVAMEAKLLSKEGFIMLTNRVNHPLPMIQ